MPNTPAAPKEEETNIVETLQSLIVAFALAMAVRSFVTEGFVIPTGSMGPTLMGQHERLKSPLTGYEFPVDSGPAFDAMRQLGAQYRDFPQPLVDPMVSPVDPIGQIPNNQIAAKSRSGDRVLVLKYLYAFAEPKRWDVVVFKNPTDPTGDAANFIKRLVGLPDEQLLFLDGDVFTAPLGAGRDGFTVARKPEYIQRAVWQPVHDSEFVPVEPMALARAWGRAWAGVPWESSEFDFGAQGNARRWTHDAATPARLEWAWDRMPITDWTDYNLWRGIPVSQRYAMSDLRVSLAIDAADPAALATEFVLGARRRNMSFSLAGGKATLRIAAMGEGSTDEGPVLAEASAPFATPAAGAPFKVEFWHVDQRLSVFVNGREVVALDYEFGTLEERLLASYYGRTVDDYARNPVFQQPTPPTLALSFEGSPVALERVSVDRDLYYRPAVLREDEFNQPDENGPAVKGLAFATDFLNPAQVGTDQFVMCGDNSAASRDSRLWGRPSKLVTEIFGEDAPFVVPRPLLLGKAWSVYFPAPAPLFGKGWNILPDAGRLRFIR